MPFMLLKCAMVPTIDIMLSVWTFLLQHGYM